MKKKFSTWVAVFALVLGGVFISPSAAVADDSGELPSCSFYQTGVGGNYGGGSYSGSGDWYAYSPVFVIGTSACEDIQITNLYYMSYGMKFRVRFYPSAGGSYANSWKYVNSGCWTCNMLIATNVLDGTWVRIEGVQQYPGEELQTVVQENFDLRY